MLITKNLSLVDEERSQHALLHELASFAAVAATQEGELVIAEELPFIDLATIRSATDEFSDSNKLGQGGFGTVYKVRHFCASNFCAYFHVAVLLH